MPNVHAIRKAIEEGIDCESLTINSLAGRADMGPTFLASFPVLLHLNHSSFLCIAALYCAINLNFILDISKHSSNQITAKTMANLITSKVDANGALNRAAVAAGDDLETAELHALSGTATLC